MSLRLRAVLITGIALVLLWGAAAGWMLRGAEANLERILDGRLAMSARMVAGLLERTALSPHSTPADFADAVQVGGGEGIECEIRTLRGEILARTTSGAHRGFDALPAGFTTRDVQGEQWRIYVLNAGGYQITTADRLDQRTQLVRDLLSAVGVPFLVALFGGLVALWIGIGRGLSPLNGLRQQLRARQIDDTTPLAVAHAPAELRTVLDAMNGLLERLSRTLSSQRAFTDAAAHELRTPLTVIDTHLQVARLSEGDDAQASLSNAEEGVKRLRHTLDQMAILARTEAPVAPADRCASVLESVTGVIMQIDHTAPGRLRLSTTGPDAAAPMPRSMLETAVRNLVDNAMRYSPHAIEVDVHVEHAHHRCRIDIADRGPGLSPEQVAQIGRRFWRGDQGRQRQDGAGLGISIVRAILERFGGTLNLKPRPDGGLVAELVIPLASDAEGCTSR